MIGPFEDVVKGWTAKRQSALVIEIVQGIWSGPWPQWGRVSPDKDGGGSQSQL